MDQSIAICVQFDAHHVNPKVERCARNHGHRWTVIVEADGAADRPQSNSRLEDDVIKVIWPWMDKSLNEIAGKGDPWEVAAWIMEMLLLHHPNLRLVSLDDGKMRAIVRRTPR